MLQALALKRLLGPLGRRAALLSTKASATGLAPMSVHSSSSKTGSAKNWRYVILTQIVCLCAPRGGRRPVNLNLEANDNFGFPCTQILEISPSFVVMAIGYSRLAQRRVNCWIWSLTVRTTGSLCFWSAMAAWWSL
jgi:hypothetical protein